MGAVVVAAASFETVPFVTCSEIDGTNHVVVVVAAAAVVPTLGTASNS